MKKISQKVGFRNYRLLFGSLLAGIIIWGCSTKLYIPSEKDVTTNATLEQLSKGKELFSSKCSKCHGLPNTDKYNKDQWKVVVDKMQPKAKITDEEKLLIMKYVTKGAV